MADSLAEVVCHKDEELQRKKGAMARQLSVRTDGTLQRKTRRITGRIPNNTQDFSSSKTRGSLLLSSCHEVVLCEAWCARPGGDHADGVVGKEVAQFEISVKDRRTAPPTGV